MNTIETIRLLKENTTTPEEMFYWATKLGSKKAAAIQLGFSLSTLIKRLTKYECDLGVMLFEPCSRCELTEFGRKHFKVVERQLEEKKRLERSA